METTEELNALSESMDWILISGKRISAVQLQAGQMESVFQRQRRQKMLKKWKKQWKMQKKNLVLNQEKS